MSTRPIAALPSTAAFSRLCAFGFLAYCSYAICRSPLLPLLARDLGASPPMVGFVVGASTLTGIALKLPAGAWSDVLGRRAMLVLAAAIFATVPFTYLGVASIGGLVALRFLHGAATAIAGPVASASVSDMAPTARRATWLSTYSMVQGAGQAAGPVIAGYLIAREGFDSAFLAAGVLACATPLMIARSPSATAMERSGRTRQVWSAILDVGRQPLILLTSMTQAAQFVLNGTLNAFLPLFALESVGLEPIHLGWLFALQTVTTLAIRPAMGMFSDRTDRRQVIVAGLTICSGAVGLVSIATGTTGLAMAVVIYAVGVAMTTSATSAYITDLSRRAHYGAAHGIFGSIYDVGDALGPIAAGLMVAVIGYRQTFRMMAVVGITTAVVFALGSRRAGREAGTR